MTRFILTLLILTALGGCGVEPPPGVSAMQGLQRGDTVGIEDWFSPYDGFCGGIVVVFGIDTKDPALVWVEYPTGQRECLHESFLYKRRHP